MPSHVCKEKTHTRSLGKISNAVTSYPYHYGTLFYPGNRATNTNPSNQRKSIAFCALAVNLGKWTCCVWLSHRFLYTAECVCTHVCAMLLPTAAPECLFPPCVWDSVCADCLTVENLCQEINQLLKASTC